jgi:hypothetical protein
MNRVYLIKKNKEFYHETHETTRKNRFYPKRPHAEAQRRRGAEVESVNFSLYYDILSFKEVLEFIKIIFQTTTLRLCASA